MSALKDRLADAAYGLGWSLVCRVPESWARWVSQSAGDIAWRRQGPRGQTLEGNLRRVIGPVPTGAELRALAGAPMHSYAGYWLEGFRPPVISPETMVVNPRGGGREKVLFDNLAAG